MTLKSLLNTAAVAALAIGLCAPLLAQAQTPAAAGAQAPAAPAAGAPSGPTTAARVTPQGDLVSTMQASGQFNTFLKLLNQANLTAVVKSSPNITVFAPTDAALAAMPPAELSQLTASPAQLQKLLTHQIINARVDSSKIKGAKGPVPSVAQNPIELDGSGEVLKADNAVIVQPDVVATNGVLHVVDHLLIPGSVPATSAASSTPDAGAAAAPSSATATEPSANAKAAAPSRK